MKTLTDAPTLTTERLILRGPEREDLAELTRFMTSAPSMIAQGETSTKEQAWFGFLIATGHWQWHGFGFFTLVEQHTMRPVGRVGLLKHSNWPEVELAWHLYEGSERKGYATEAGFAVKSWAYIDTENTRSQGVARRLCAVTDGTRAPHEPDAEVWVHTSE